MAKRKYEWKFAQVGGVTRVRIETGSDIAHLDELDQKMWTVLSCPVKGLEIDERTLEFMDSDHDGKIRVHEVVNTVKWLTSVLVSPDLLLNQKDTLRLADISQKTDDGKKIYHSAQEILKNLGAQKDEINIADVSDTVAIFAQTKFNGDGVITIQSADDDAAKIAIESVAKTVGTTPDRSGINGVTAEQIETFYAACADYAAWNAARCPLPYGETTEAALATYNALKEKIDDYFVRCKLAAFNEAAVPALDVSVERLENAGERNLAACMDEIAALPLARISDKAVLPLDGGINPAWEQTFAELKRLVFDVDFPDAHTIDETEWRQITDKFAPYIAWKKAKKGEIVEPLGLDTVEELLKQDKQADLLALVEKDKAFEGDADSIVLVDKLLHLCRDFYKLLRNFVTLSDFYVRNAGKKSIFQAGTLYIDQRSCDLCLKVTDMARHNAMAAASGMYLIYCDCYSKEKNSTMSIVAVMTSGDVNNLTIGKNAVFYDRSGLDWDATVTKIIDNPISIGQAFWSPYRKFGKFIEEQINKFAAEKDSKVTTGVTSKISESTGKLADTDMTTATPQADKKTQAFDIAKFCGIFAAIGMAIGYIGGFLVACVNGFLQLTWWQMPLALLAIMLLISGPSMIMAWLKLRRRNLAPLLNANGWAVNSNVPVNILFGATLTKTATFPKLNLKDPFVKRSIPTWRKAFYITLAVIVVLLVVLYFTGLLACVGLPFPISAESAVVCDSIAAQPMP